MNRLARLLFGAAVLILASRVAAESPPNVVMLVVDDLGATDLGCFGSTFYETPHLDQLAASGMRFTSAYAACPVCSPTRASIMTGHYPVRVGITDFINANNTPDKWDRNTKLLPAPGETRNVANEHTDIVDRLQRLLNEWRCEVGTKMPTENPKHRPLLLASARPAVG